MTALDLLRQRGPMPALHIAQALHVPIGDVYAELVKAETQGRVRINVHHYDKHNFCEWEAMDEAPT